MVQEHSIVQLDQAVDMVNQVIILDAQLAEPLTLFIVGKIPVARDLFEVFEIELLPVDADEAVGMVRRHDSAATANREGGK